MLEGIGIAIQLPQLSKSYRRRSVMSDILEPLKKKQNNTWNYYFGYVFKLNEELEMIAFYMLTVPILKILKKSQTAQNSAKMLIFIFQS